MDNASLHDVLSCCCRCVPVMRSFMRISATGGFKSREHQPRSIQVFLSRGVWSPEFVWSGIVASFRGLMFLAMKTVLKLLLTSCFGCRCVVTDRVDGRF